MPRYDFGCRACDHRIEVDHSIHEYVTSAASFCPICNDVAIFDRRITRATLPSVHLKGYGFYKTDNLPADEKYARDHFDGSGTNAEHAQMSRRIQDPDSTVPRLGGI